jgi:selenocysteine lyase/cysteine desulfurase
MNVSRRMLFGGMVAMSAATAGPIIALARDREVEPSLPDRDNFHIDHVYLNAAYAHPMGDMTYRAIEDFLQRRRLTVDTPWPADNARDEAVRLFAALINADPKDIAIVPSTMEGENLVVQALGLGPTAGVVTDAYHYSPEIYGEQRLRGVPVDVILPYENRIALKDIDHSINSTTRLVAVSAVASDTGFRHDLKAICQVAHKKGAFVYADIIQAAGAVPIDVKDSGVDFCCCGAYKWLMGDFGVAFLYVRPDRLKDLQRVFTGWRQYKTYSSHLYPFDPPGAPGVDYTLSDDTVGLFEVSTPNWAALAGLTASLAYLHDLSVDKIVRHRAPLMARLQGELPRYGYLPLTPVNTDTPAIAFAYDGAAAKLGPPLKAARIKIQTSRNRIRISPSVYNDMADIDRLIQVLRAAA